MPSPTREPRKRLLESFSRGQAGQRPKAGHPARVVERALAGAPLQAQELMELQRLAGNQSVGLLMQRAPAGTITAPAVKRPARAPAKPAPKKAATPPGPKARWSGEVGPDAGPQQKGKILRVPIEGLPEGRAIVLVPDWIGKKPK